MSYFINIINTIVKSRYKMLPYAGYIDPESTLAIGVHHDGQSALFAHCIILLCLASTLLPRAPSN